MVLNTFPLFRESHLKDKKRCESSIILLRFLKYSELDYMADTGGVLGDESTGFEED
jgi:hypothetical protein